MGGWPCSLCCNLDVSRAAHLAAPQQQLLAARWAARVITPGMQPGRWSSDWTSTPCGPHIQGPLCSSWTSCCPSCQKKSGSPVHCSPRICQELPAAHMHICARSHARVRTLTPTHACASSHAGRYAHSTRASAHTHSPTAPTCASTHRSPSPQSLLNPAARLNPKWEPVTPHCAQSQSQGHYRGLRGTMWSGPTLVRGWSPDAPRLPLCLCAGSSWPGVLLPPRLTSSDPDCLHLRSSSCPDSDLSP